MNARMMTATRIKWNLVGGRFRIRFETEAAELVKGRSFKELHIKKGHAVTTQLLLLLVLPLLLSSAAAGGAAAAAGAAAAGAASLWKNPDSSKILMRLAVSEGPSGDGLERMTSSWVVRLKTPVAQRLIVVVVVDCVVGCGRGRGRG